MDAHTAMLIVAASEIEDTVLVTSNGCENLTTFPKRFEL